MAFDDSSLPAFMFLRRSERESGAYGRAAAFPILLFSHEAASPGNRSKRVSYWL